MNLKHITIDDLKFPSTITIKQFNNVTLFKHFFHNFSGVRTDDVGTTQCNFVVKREDEVLVSTTNPKRAIDVFNQCIEDSKKKYVVLQHIQGTHYGMMFWSTNSNKNTRSSKNELWYKEILFTDSAEEAKKRIFGNNKNDH